MTLSLKLEKNAQYSYSIEQLESVVIYNRPQNLGAAIGASLQLIDDSTLNYSGEITVGVARYRYDGPAISNVTSFANGNSTTQIVNSSFTSTNVTNIINTLSLYNYLRIIVNKNNGGTRTKISRAYFNGTFNDPAGQLGTNKNNNSFLGLDLSGEYLRLGIPNEINLNC